jgi:two-component system, OmpR family, alkaline phosphatase synthesis response regulator PhoP
MDRELMDSMREHPSVEPVQSPRRTDSEENPPTILIVDDNAQNLELIQAYLEDVECVTVPAYNGMEALDLVARKKPDLILLDVMMPKMSGFEVCRRLKSNPETSTIPIIMVTALSEFGDVERGIDCGTDDFVSKPVNRLELLTRVRTMLKLKHLTDTLQRTMAYLSEIEQQAQATPTGKAP